MKNNSIIFSEPKPGEIVYFGCDVGCEPSKSALVCWVVRGDHFLIINID